MNCRGRMDAQSRQHTEHPVALQGKTIFKSLDTNGWGLGLAAGTLWHPKDNSNHRAYDLYARLPMSFSFKRYGSSCTAISAGIVTVQSKQIIYYGDSYSSGSHYAFELIR